MEFIAEIIVNLLLLLRIWLVRWCASHKNITLMILVIAAMFIDVLVIVKFFWGR